MAHLDANTFATLDWKVVDPATLNDNLTGKTIIRAEPVGGQPGIPTEGVILYLRDQHRNVMAVMIGASEFDTASEYPVLVSAARVDGVDD